MLTAAAVKASAGLLACIHANIMIILLQNPPSGGTPHIDNDPIRFVYPV
jgi:hypothetical protein